MCGMQIHTTPITHVMCVRTDIAWHADTNNSTNPRHVCPDRHCVACRHTQLQKPTSCVSGQTMRGMQTHTTPITHVMCVRTDIAWHADTHNSKNPRHVWTDIAWHADTHNSNNPRHVWTDIAWHADTHNSNNPRHVWTDIAWHADTHNSNNPRHVCTDIAWHADTHNSNNPRHVWTDIAWHADTHNSNNPRHVCPDRHCVACRHTQLQ